MLQFRKYINDLYNHITSTIKDINKSYEIIFVDDGSSDNGWKIIQSLCKIDNNVVGVQLSRNFGQHSAIYAGLKNSTGEWVVVMDSDMQDHPAIIKDLYSKAQEGFDTVFAKRTKQNASFFKRLGSSLFYKTFNYLTEMNIPEHIGNYGIYHKNVINSVVNMKEYRRNFVIMVNWVGFKTTYIDTFRNERILSESTYNIFNLFRLALSTIIYFSNKPLKLITEIGFLISLSLQLLVFIL